MSNCTNCFNGCTEIVSDRCIRYTGIDVPALGISTGDTLSHVESSIIDFLVPVLTGVGIKPIIDDTIICNVVRQYLPTCTTCTGFTLNDVLSAIIEAACNLQLQINANVNSINAINSTLTILNADYTLPSGCLTGVTASSDTHAILQATINKLCQLNTDLPNTYVAIANLNTLIQAYLNSTTTNLISNKMVPYAVLPYFGPLTNFDSQGAGLNLTSTTGENWTKVYLCNGVIAPDLRGRALTGAISSVPGPTITDPVVLPGGNNPNYVLGTAYGANQITLGPTQIPPLTHTHATTVTIVDPGHNHTFSASNGGDGSGSGYPATGVAQEGGGSFGMQNNQTGLKGTGAGQNVTVTNSDTTLGGGLPHPNIQPVIACYYIQYRP